MRRFIEGEDRSQSTLFPDRLEDWINEDNPVRVVDVFVDELDLGGLGFVRVAPERPAGRVIILRFCLSFISTAISTGFNRAAGWNANPGAMWK